MHAGSNKVHTSVTVGTDEVPTVTGIFCEVFILLLLFTYLRKLCTFYSLHFQTDLLL